VIKPAVSAAARETYAMNSTTLSDHEQHFSRLIQKETMMLQPFIESVVERGELSLMMIGDRFSHAVLKVAKPGDFRVQDDFGGTVHPYIPTPAEVDLALKTVNACPESPLYARVDMVNDNDGNPAVSELELVEPEMWFRQRPESADELAMEIMNRVGTI
jgi:glutathione synthase/RimK-type ligase-like ATP-grasp enzyme